MRITGGIYRGRTVACPPGIIRPAMDMMRESLFSILGSLEGKTWLDLFTGSGCVGIEAASRGASLVHLVEKKTDRKKATIMDNISMVESEIKLFMADVRRFIPTAKKMQYDIVYADPPFPMQGKVDLAKAVDKQKNCSPLEACSSSTIHPKRRNNGQKQLAIWFVMMSANMEEAPYVSIETPKTRT